MRFKGSETVAVAFLCSARTLLAFFLNVFALETRAIDIGKSFINFHVFEIGLNIDNCCNKVESNVRVGLDENVEDSGSESVRGGINNNTTILSRVINPAWEGTGAQGERVLIGDD